MFNCGRTHLGWAILAETNKNWQLLVVNLWSKGRSLIETMVVYLFFFTWGVFWVDFWTILGFQIIDTIECICFFSFHWSQETMVIYLFLVEGFQQLFIHSPSPIIEGNKIKSSIPPLIHDGGFLFVYFLILILNF